MGVVGTTLVAGTVGRDVPSVATWVDGVGEAISKRQRQSQFRMVVMAEGCLL